MDIIQLYQDYNVEFRTEGHKHCRPGWVNTECPWCSGDMGHEGYHLGYDIAGNRFTCWRCGWHPIAPTLVKLIHLSEREIRQIVKQYDILIPLLPKTPEVKTFKKNFKLPSGLDKLSKQHMIYLVNRGFTDPEELQRTWNLMSAGPISKLRVNDEKVLNYKYRIVIPFYWNEKIVSFDSRDTTDLMENKYQACPLELEMIPHKHIIYCKQEALQDVAICVEGPTDVWRFGVNSFATSGIKFVPEQVRLIAKMFKRVPVCFDGGEPQAILQANKLVSELKFRGVDSFRVDIEGDPGAMEQSEANYLVKQLIK